MRKGTLRVALNSRVKYNYQFMDPNTNTRLIMTQPVSNDLNKGFTNQLTGEVAQMDLVNIKKGLNSGVLTIFEGQLDGFEKQMVAPIESDINITSEMVSEWNQFVQSKMLDKVTSGRASVRE